MNCLSDMLKYEQKREFSDEFSVISIAGVWKTVYYFTGTLSMEGEEKRTKHWALWGTGGEAACRTQDWDAMLHYIQYIQSLLISTVSSVRFVSKRINLSTRHFQDIWHMIFPTSPFLKGNSSYFTKCCFSLYFPHYSSVSTIFHLFIPGKNYTDILGITLNFEWKNILRHAFYFSWNIHLNFTTCFQSASWKLNVVSVSGSSTDSITLRTEMQG